MLRRFLRPAGVLALVSLVPGRPAHANLIVNGSFETGPAVSDAVQLNAGSGAIQGWVVSSGTVDYVGTRWSAAEGARSVGLNGAAPGGLSQTFATIPSEQYTVRFYMAGDTGTLPVIKRLRVSAAGASQDFDVDLTGMWEWDPGWSLRVFHFTAGTTATTLAFTSLDAGAAGPAVDSVTVSVSNPVDAGDWSSTPVSLTRMTPNPVRDRGEIGFRLAAGGFASLRVLDIRGREVAILARGEYAAGAHGASWNGRQGAQPAPAGIYFVELRTAGARRVQRIAVLR